MDNYKFHIQKTMFFSIITSPKGIQIDLQTFTTIVHGV